MEEILNILKKGWSDIFFLLEEPMNDDVDMDALEVNMDDIGSIASNTFFSSQK